MKFQDVIENRRSFRKFSDKKVKWPDILEAIDAALQAPFAGNINNLQFVIVQNQEKKNLLAEHAQQNWIAEASAIIIVCSDYKHLKELYGEESGDTYGKQHAGAAIENFLLKITDLRLASCWIGAYASGSIRRDFEIPERMEIEALLPVGHLHITSKVKKPRKTALENAIHWDSWNTRKKPVPYHTKKI